MSSRSSSASLARLTRSCADTVEEEIEEAIEEERRVTVESEGESSGSSDDSEEVSVRLSVEAASADRSSFVRRTLTMTTKEKQRKPQIQATSWLRGAKILTRRRKTRKTSSVASWPRCSLALERRGSRLSASLHEWMLECQ